MNHHPTEKHKFDFEMEAYYFAVDNNFQFLDGAVAQVDAKGMHQDVVEISSDEEEELDDGQPEPSRRTTCSTATTKRTVTIDSDEDDMNYGFEAFHPFKDHTRVKRQKLEDTALMDGVEYHVETANVMDIARSDVPGSGIANLAPQAGKVHFTPGEPNQDIDRATFAFRPHVNLQTTGVLNESGETDRHENYCSSPQAEVPDEGPRLKSPPYYNDPKLEVRMYRGPGYEMFPVVLGSVPEHVDICDEWDRRQEKLNSRLFRKQTRGAELARYVNDTFEPDSSNEDDDDDDESVVGATELQCLHRIREVLPDIQREFVLAKIRDNIQVFRSNNDDEISILPNPADIVAHILELPEYPKEKKPKEAKEPAPDGTGVTIEWSKGDVDSKTYQRDAVCLLASQFERTPTHFIFKTVGERKSLFDAYVYIQSLDVNYDSLPAKERPYRRSLNPRVALEKKYSAREHDTRSTTQWNDLVNELQAAKQQVERERLRVAREKLEEAMEEANLHEHKANGTIVECQCCFDEEVPMNRAVSCDDKDIHWFCYGCIRRLAANQIGSMKHEMTCMHQSGCKANLSRDGLSRAMPSKLADKLAFYQQQFEITAACIEGLEQCPFCDFKAICDPIEVDSIFQCQNPECKRVSCRRCHEDSHLPKSCEEVKVDRRLSARHQVEEARSEAMMRPCPKCKVKIIKELGCNKMRCAKCGCVMCYVCKADISHRKDSGYGHFNEPGAKCTLNDQDFDRHEAEADEAEKEAIRRVQAENTDLDEAQLQIETGRVKKPKPIPRRDELGLGWGRAFDNILPLANEVNFQEMQRQNRNRVEDFQRRLLELQRRNQRIAPPVAVQQPRQHPTGLAAMHHHNHRGNFELVPPRLPNTPAPYLGPNGGHWPHLHLPLVNPAMQELPHAIIDRPWLEGPQQDLMEILDIWHDAANIPRQVNQLHPNPAPAVHEQVAGRNNDPLVADDVFQPQPTVHAPQPPPYQAHGQAYARDRPFPNNLAALQGGVNINANTRNTVIDTNRVPTGMVNLAPQWNDLGAAGPWINRDVNLRY